MLQSRAAGQARRRGAEELRRSARPEAEARGCRVPPGDPGTGTNLLWTLMLLHNRDEDATFAYLKELHNSILQYSKSGAAPAQMASRGEIAVGIVFSDNCTKLIESGTDLVLTYPEEGTGFSMGSISLVAGAKNPAAAKVFIDWQISPKGQNIGPEVNMFSNPSNVNAEVLPNMVDPEKVKLLDFDPAEAAAGVEPMIPRFDAEIAPAPKE
ncbi:extracellular solute-binding protein [Tessaracoccus sp.]|uniref:extracellular solute-binding protein n=1 Tax=Tessaracoccus sp. TaxID=1971211 RepID=UPI00262291C9|nr:extracellular solute-binding protein [Tessaracoccus sp.]